MTNFSFRCPTRLIFGKDTIPAVADNIKAAGGARVLFVFGGGSIRKNGVYEKVVKSLTEGGLFFIELSGVQPNPKLSLVRKGIEIFKKEKLDFILAAGGGSVIDTCKAISFGTAIPEGKDIWNDYFMKAGTEIPKGPDVGTILTLPAAGSEMSNSCVISNEETKIKRGINSENNYPAFSISDPSVCFTLPQYQTACGSVDMFSHMMERYFTNTPDVALTDALLEGAMKVVIQYGPMACRNPRNYAFRENLMLASSLAHNNMFGSGRVGDWASHWLEHELSGKYDIAHGAGLAIMIPAWMKYVYKVNEQRFMQFAVNIMGSNVPITEKNRLIMDGIERLEAWFRSMGLATRLSEAGITDRDFEVMATRLLSGGRTAAGHLMSLGHDDIVNIYKLAL